MNAEKIIQIARRNIGGVMESSARLCLADAIERYNEGRFDLAKMWAIKSITYSVGIFHPDYQKVIKTVY